MEANCDGSSTKPPRPTLPDTGCLITSASTRPSPRCCSFGTRTRPFTGTFSMPHTMSSVAIRNGRGGSANLTSSSFGITARRDTWVFNSSGKRLRELVERQVAFFNKQVQQLRGDTDVVASDPTQFKWDLAAERLARRGIPAVVQASGFRSAIYRPFFRQHYYMDRVLTSAVSQIPKYFPSPGIRNPAIAVERDLRASSRSPAVIAVDAITEGAIAGASGQKGQMLPRYVYDERSNPAQEQLLPDEPSRRDNITYEALNAYRARYDNWVTKDQIFSYVYGILHSPEYRERYAADLAKLLPRMPEVSTSESFHAFSEAGQRLLDLHIGYEQAEPYPLIEELSSNVPDRNQERYRVRKDALGRHIESPGPIHDRLQRMGHASWHSR